MKKETIAQVRSLNIKERMSAVLYPRVCPVCGRLLGAAKISGNIFEKNQRDEPTPFNPYICPECYKKLDFADGRARCMKCSKPLDGETDELCEDCRKRIRYFTSGMALMMHNEPARKILYDLKYSSMRDNADFLAFEAARRFCHLLEFWDLDVIIPVPLHWLRQHERGYNQAGLIACRLAMFLEIAGLDIPVDEEYLVRTKKTVALKELGSAERSKSLRGAFAVQGTAGKYKRVLLIDDIFTSGSTINECAKVLKSAGAEDVFFLTASIGN